jgi:hypothetical protein
MYFLTITVVISWENYDSRHTHICRAEYFLRNRCLFIWYKNFLICMNPQVPFPCSQKLAKRPYSEAPESVPHLIILYPYHTYVRAYVYMYVRVYRPSCDYRNMSCHDTRTFPCFKFLSFTRVMKIRPINSTSRKTYLFYLYNSFTFRRKCMSLSSS